MYRRKVIWEFANVFLYGFIGECHFRANIGPSLDGVAFANPVAIVFIGLLAFFWVFKLFVVEFVALWCAHSDK